MTENRDFPTSELMSTYHILGHPDMTITYDPEHCPVCAGTLEDLPNV